MLFIDTSGKMEHPSLLINSLKGVIYCTKLYYVKLIFSKPFHLHATFLEIKNNHLYQKLSELN